MFGPRTFSTFVHQDGSRQAYEVLGSEHLGHRIPLVLVNGMSMLRGDWERLANCLSQLRPVLIFDHRGTGNSTWSKEGKEVITLELMARDLFDLLVHLEWMEMAICGYSMGGAIAQQLLHLPFHPTDATPLPFRVTHLFLTATLSQKITAEQDTGFARRFKEMPPPKDGVKRTFEERRELSRPTTEMTFDPVWIEQHPDRLNWYLDQMALGGRPVKTILMQARGLGKIDFAHQKLCRETKILVIHGSLDQVIPYSVSRQTLENIPWAKDVEVGNTPGQVPNLDFGHQWFEYFDIGVWRDVFEVFMDDPQRVVAARL